MLRKFFTYTFALLSLIILFTSCKKEYESAASIDDATITTYLQNNNLTSSFTKDPSGFYYQVVAQGTGTTFLNTDSVLYGVTIKSLTNGTVYDQSPVNYNLGKFVGNTDTLYAATTQSFAVVIPAIRTAMLNLKPGGSARIILPSSLAFGRNGLNAVPAGEVIDLIVTTLPYTRQSDLDDYRIRTFLTEKGLTATKDPSGVYYNISAPGTGTAVINGGSTLVANYTGRTLDGTVFDSSTDGTASFVLKGDGGSTIVGWQKVIPKLKAGGKMRMLVPSGLAYGPAGSTGINGNAILDFDVEIVSVTN